MSKLEELIKTILTLENKSTDIFPLPIGNYEVCREASIKLARVCEVLLVELEHASKYCAPESNIKLKADIALAEVERILSE